MSKRIELPHCFEAGEGPRVLSEAERAGLSDRLAYISEITEKIRGYDLNSSDNESILDFLEDLELDASANLSNLGAPEAILPWVMHVSWIDELPRLQQSEQLSSAARGIMGGQPPPAGAEGKEVIVWLTGLAQRIEQVLSLFSRANSSNDAVFCIYLIDIVLAEMLFGLFRVTFFAKTSIRAEGV